MSLRRKPGHSRVGSGSWSRKSGDKSPLPDSFIHSHSIDRKSGSFAPALRTSSSLTLISPPLRTSQDLSKLDNVVYFVYRQLRVQKTVLRAKEKFVKLKKKLVQESSPKYPFVSVLRLALENILTNCPPGNQDIPDQCGDEKQVAFPAKGSSETPPHKYGDFSVVNYSSKAFAHIRFVFAVNVKEIISSICTMPLMDFIPNSKSGELFFLSSDSKFMIKTLKPRELSFLQKDFLSSYVEHVHKHRDTLLVNFLGVFRIQSKEKDIGENTFVVMRNVFYSNRQLHLKFDIKGSTVGRNISTDKLLHSLSPIMKDKEFTDLGINIRLGGENKTFLHQLAADCRLLQSFNIMDYSLLVGIHDRLQQALDDRMHNFWKETYGVKHFLPFAALQQAVSSGAQLETLESRNLDLMRALESERYEWSTADHKYDSVEDFAGSIRVSEDKRYVFYMGIIDFFQTYDMKKRVEHSYKGLTNDAKAISAVPADQYAERLFKFVSEAVDRKSHYRSSSMEDHFSRGKSFDSFFEFSRPSSASLSRIGLIPEDETLSTKTAFAKIAYQVWLQGRIELRVQKAKEAFLTRRKKLVVKDNVKGTFCGCFQIALPSVLTKVDLDSGSKNQDDSSEEMKFDFPAMGTEVAPPHPYPSFQIYSLAPNTFAKIRQVSKVSEETIAASFKPSSPLIDFITNSKSGEMFIFTDDNRFMIKTMKKTEVQFMQKTFLKSYLYHLQSFPHTLLVRMFGLFRLKNVVGADHYIMLMENVFYTQLQLHKKFDLKGSTVGRNVPESTRRRKLAPVLKDMEFELEKITIDIGDRGSEVSSQLVADSLFLESLNIMDYSLLVGIHDRLEGRREFHNARNSNSIAEKPYTTLKRRLNGEIFRHFPAADDVKMTWEEEAKIAGDLDSVTLRRGILSNDQRFVYYLGIIDILQTFDMKKALEHQVKGLNHDKTAISAVPANLYSKRLCKFFLRALDPSRDSFRLQDGIAGAVNEVLRLKRVESKVLEAKVKFLKKKKLELDESHALHELFASLAIGLPHCLKAQQKRKDSYSPVEPKDFTDEIKLEFPPGGTSQTPAHKLSQFHIKMYGPHVFAKIRVLFGHSQERFVQSLCSSGPLIDFRKASKSRDVFFMSNDKLFVIKGLTRPEISFIQKKFLEKYWNYIVENKGTFISKLLGVFKMRLGGKNSEDIYFLVMENVFKSRVPVHQKFEIKGLRRETPDKLKTRLAPILYDDEFNRRDVQLNLGRNQDKVIEQIISDVKFLRDLNIVDYSFLIGMYDRKTHQNRLKMDQRWQEYHAKHPLLPYEALKIAIRDRKHLHSPRMNPDDSNDMSSPSFFEPMAKELIGNGIESANSRYVYFFGFIDILREFKVTKQLESQVRALQYRRSLVSVTNPAYYCNRFCKAIQRPFQTTQVSEMLNAQELKLGDEPPETEEKEFSDGHSRSSFFLAGEQSKSSREKVKTIMKKLSRGQEEPRDNPKTYNAEIL